MKYCSVRRVILFFILVIIAKGTVYPQDFFDFEAGVLHLDNSEISRTIELEKGRIFTKSLQLPGEESYIDESREFSFLLNGKAVNGFSGWEMIEIREINDEKGGAGAALLLEGKDSLSGIEVELNYLLYPDLPIIRKWLEIKNTTEEDICIESLNVEDLQTNFSYIQSVVLRNYARMKHIGKYIGNWDDPVIVVHEQTRRRGIALGNEAPGVMKRTAFHTIENNLEAGLSHVGENYAFRRWLSTNEAWKSPATFIGLYAGRNDPFEIVNREVNQFISHYMKPRITEVEEKPVFVYNTWYPFRTFVNDSLIREVAAAAAECGIQEFIIDDGWQINVGSESSKEEWGGNYGDWKVDENKFPGGLKPTFDYIKSLGMKPGLWISIGAATNDSRVFREYPEWFVENSDKKPGNLHYNSSDSHYYTSCFGTGFKDYIREVILDLYEEYGLAYVKLDLSVISSAYINDENISGCYAETHPFHRDRNESYLVIYERMLEMFDEVHKKAPELFMDCTFETAGKLQLMDYAIAAHAEGNWLSNFEEPSPVGPLRVRQMAWWRSPALPAGSLVIGNQQLEDKDFDFVLKSLIGTLPIVLGDPREIPVMQREQIKKWSDWMQEMQKKYDYMSYRQDLPGFGEPGEGYWDGWQRINTLNKKGGVVGVFRQNAKESSRQVFIDFLSDEDLYVVKFAPGGDEIIKASGRDLREKGFGIEVDQPYYGLIFEVERQDAEMKKQEEEHLSDSDLAKLN